MSNLSEFLLQYLTSDHCFAAVLVPLTITLPGLRSLWASKKEALLFVACTILSYLLARWEVTDDSKSLYIVPVCVFFIAWSVYMKQEWTPLKAFSWTFLSLIIVDCTKAIELIDPLAFDWYIFYGVGGAGLKDGLLIFPTLTAALVMYAHWRQSHRELSF